MTNKELISKYEQLETKWNNHPTLVVSYEDTEYSVDWMRTTRKFANISKNLRSINWQTRMIVCNIAWRILNDFR